MTKLIMLQGLPASGKSTVAKELCSSKKTARVNRDLLREMLHFGEYSGANEGAVVEAEKAIAETLLLDGVTVIVDDCNLNPANETMWRNVASGVGVDFEIKEVDTDIEECIKRDKWRANSVGESVIRGMALQYCGLSIKGGVVICDIDGTIANIDHRLHYVQGEKKDWNSFFHEMDGDELRLDTHELLEKAEEMGHTIIFVSARPENYRPVTESWLKEHTKLTSPLTVLMRKKNDTRDDTIVKKEIYNKYLSKLDIKFVVDDRPKVIRMWQELGLDTVDVGNGIEF